MIKKAANDLINSTYNVALTGAGVSTESGIPDFRGPLGIWTKNPEAERRAYQSYERFLKDPKLWWEERLNSSSSLGNLAMSTPNAGHYALATLEEMGVLKCVITQNVDGLHEKAGNKKLLEYHGNFSKLRCISCGSRFKRDEFNLQKLKIKNLLPPHCPRCGGIIKTDGVAFGEPIPQDVAKQSLEEVLKCDLILICGTSAIVYPFAGLPRAAKQKKKNTITIIEINAEPTPLTYEGISNYIIQGKTGEILPRIVEEIRKIRSH